MIIERALVADTGAIAELLQLSFDPELRPFLAYAQHGVAAFLSDILVNPLLFADRHLLVCRASDGTVIGFAEFRISSRTEGFLYYICVSPAARRHGVATAMIDTFLADNAGLATLGLDVFATNDAAITLYGKRGFVRSGQSDWCIRPIPAAGPDAPGHCLVANSTPLAAFYRYGFCELTLDFARGPLRIGRIGAAVLRCSSAEIFQDDALLAAAAAVLPPARTAFLIRPAELRGGRLRDEALLRSSYRMVLAVEP
ncbi:GNAT family N-acetyltransferase [Sphingomonas crusticola]|uniref:GNAT family N-acetyltransferase n=1 Tax=Sphingomonas crusticola TaxID=1697973 RepID=UPI000E22DC78|nr:N-acetyltransferase [Sphingomonas crusticola]